MMFLVDTSVFINYLKGTETKATRFLDKAIEQDFCITPIIYQELLQGAKDAKELATLQDYLRSQFFCYPADQIESYEKAARIFFDCRKKGITIRSTVACLIAQIAIDNAIALLHDDGDFVKIATVCRLALVL